MLTILHYLMLHSPSCSLERFPTTLIFFAMLRQLQGLVFVNAASGRSTIDHQQSYQSIPIYNIPPIVSSHTLLQISFFPLGNRFRCFSLSQIVKGLAARVSRALLGGSGRVISAGSVVHRPLATAWLIAAKAQLSGATMVAATGRHPPNPIRTQDDCSNRRTTGRFRPQRFQKPLALPSGRSSPNVSTPAGDQWRTQQRFRLP